MSSLGRRRFYNGIVYQNSGNLVFSASLADQLMTFDKAQIKGKNWDTATNQYNVTLNGYYHVAVYCKGNNPNVGTNSEMTLRITKNGTQMCVGFVLVPSGLTGREGYIYACTDMQCQAGDELQFYLNNRNLSEIRVRAVESGVCVRYLGT